MCYLLGQLLQVLSYAPLTNPILLPGFEMEINSWLIKFCFLPKLAIQSAQRLNDLARTSQIFYFNIQNYINLRIQKNLKFNYCQQFITKAAQLLSLHKQYLLNALNIFDFLRFFGIIIVYNKDLRIMAKAMIAFKQKIDAIHDYLFPDEHSISVHHSITNTNTLFYIRLFSLIYLSGIYIWSITTTYSALNNIIYLTMQGYFLTWLFFLLCIQDYMINGFGKWGRVFPLCNNLKYYIQIIYEIAFCVQLPITIVFWGFLFKIILDMEGVTTEIIIINANLHAGPLVVLILDMFYNTFSFPPQHFHTVLFFSLLYGIVNLTYSLACHIIYKPIDWVSILSYILMGGAIVMAFIMHWLGRFIFQKCKKDKIQSQMIEGLISTQSKSQNLKASNDKRKTGSSQIRGSKQKTEDIHNNEDLNVSVITDSEHL